MGATFSLRLPCVHHGPDVLDTTPHDHDQLMGGPVNRASFDSTTSSHISRGRTRASLTSMFFTGTGGSLRGISMVPGDKSSRKSSGEISAKGSGRGSGRGSFPELFFGRTGGSGVVAVEGGRGDDGDAHPFVQTSRQHRSSLTPLPEALNEQDTSVRMKNDKVSVFLLLLFICYSNVPLV